MIIDRISWPKARRRAATSSAECKDRLGVRARSAFRRFNGYMKNMIEAIADAKLRRMQRELELHGIRFDRSSDSWVTGQSTATECGE